MKSEFPSKIIDVVADLLGDFNLFETPKMFYNSTTSKIRVY